MKRFPVFGLFALSVAFPACFGLAANICMEAESAVTNEAPMLRVQTDVPQAGIKPMEGASGRAYLEVPLGAGKTPKVKAGTARILVDVPADGAYTFWLRTLWDGECSNTILVQIDDRPPFLVGADATYHAWHWVKYPVSRMTPPPTLTKGLHTLTIIHREDGVRLDQLLLTSSPRFVPVGTEKAGVSP
ncbi:MAG: hypothetical protein WCI17_00965 [bacterium]